MESDNEPKIIKGTSKNPTLVTNLLFLPNRVIRDALKIKPK